MSPIPEKEISNIYDKNILSATRTGLNAIDNIDQSGIFNPSGFMNSPSQNKRENKAES